MAFTSVAAQTSRAALRSAGFASSARRAAAPAAPWAVSRFSTSSHRPAEVASAGSEAGPSSQPAGAAASAGAVKNPKLASIVDQIEGLTLLEAAELVTQLKERLNITEVAMPAAAPSGAAPAAAAAAQDGAEGEAEKPKEKTIFALKLTGLKEPTAKAKVIKEVKALNSNMNLVEAKKFVESTPQMLKEGLNKEDVEKLKNAIEAAGGTVEIE